MSTPQGRILMEQNAHDSYTPASILKILTGFAAVSHFGKEYRFPTKACFDETTGTLYIKGFGDPLFVSEAIEEFSGQIADSMKRQKANQNSANPHPLTSIVLDQDFFAPDIHIPGTGSSENPYDASLGALCANFNTVSFQKNPATGKYGSAEPQTPLFREFLPAVKAAGTSQGRILIPKNLQSIYPGMLMAYFLETKGIRTGPSETGKSGPQHCRITTGPFPAEPQGELTFFSPFVLEEAVQKLLRYSNNLIANHLILAAGADKYGAPATLEKGVRFLTSFARETMGMELLHIFEGSGLSRKNKITPAQMGKVLQYFDPLYGLLRENTDTYYKTGTLTGVRCLAGYIKGKKGSRFPFVIMVKQPNPEAVPGRIVSQLIEQVKNYEKKIGGEG